MNKIFNKMTKVQVISTILCFILIITSIVVLIYIKTQEKSLNQTKVIEPSKTQETELIDSENWFVTDDLPDCTQFPPQETASLPTEPEIEPPTEPTIVETEPTEPPGPDPERPETWTVQLSESEINLLATAIYLEGGTESMDCQKGIGSVILNRMTTREMSLEEVLYEGYDGYYQFSVAPYLNQYSPDEDSMTAAMDLVVYGPTMPTCVVYFRANHYHNLWKAEDWCSIDRTYFSHDTRLCSVEGGCSFEVEETEDYSELNDLSDQQS